MIQKVLKFSNSFPSFEMIGSLTCIWQNWHRNSLITWLDDDFESLYLYSYNLHPSKFLNVLWIGKYMLQDLHAQMQLVFSILCQTVYLMLNQLILNIYTTKQISYTTYFIQKILKSKNVVFCRNGHYFFSESIYLAKNVCPHDFVPSVRA